jgi:hypothetical protein
MAGLAVIASQAEEDTDLPEQRRKGHLGEM